ncbi:MAG TPA: hypothetical protein VFB13_19165 [Reyranella sp.]|nr:hypothetical protein [Reyranella sp.]
MLVVDRQRILGGTLGRYAINSDSLGGAYLEFLDAKGIPDELRAMRDDPVAREMERFYDGFPSLDLVYRFLLRLGTAMEAVIARHPASAFWSGTDVRSLHLKSDGTLEARTVGPDGTAAVISARTAIVALGGRQHWIQQPLCPGLALENCLLRYVMPSDRLLSHIGLKEAGRILHSDRERPIVILGGSHSAYSAAWTLANLLPGEVLGQRRVYILQRRPPRIFYASRQAAEADDYPVDDGDICPRTQRVNRLGGLRSDGRDMWRRIAGRPDVPRETRFTVLPLNELPVDEVRRLLEDAALVIPAFGYRSATLPIFDPKGRRLELSADAGGNNVAQDCRLLLADGTTLPNVFGIGLGTGYRPFGAMGGEPNFNGQANSLWLYQHGIGAMVHRGILEQLEGATSSRKRTHAVEASERWPISLHDAPQSAE